MTVRALDLLIDNGLITSAGKTVNLMKLPQKTVSSRISKYIEARIQISQNEIEDFKINTKLNGQFSTWSSKVTKDKILSSSLVYDSIIVDDPLVSSSSSISIDRLRQGLEFFSWAYNLIRAGYIKVLPITFFNEPSSVVPLFDSDDAFRSLIPSDIHDFAHENVILKSIMQGETPDKAYVLTEEAHVKRRTALNVQFKDDFVISGVNSFRHLRIIGNETNSKGEFIAKTRFEPNGTLTEEEFERWSYQSINQALMKRLEAIYNETHLANTVGHTYITESDFEAKLLSMSGNNEKGNISTAARFLEANKAFIQIESPELILNLREHYSYAFDRFNSTLLYLSEQLSSVEEGEFEKKAQSLYTKEILPQVDEINEVVKSISTGTLTGTLASIGTLVFAFSGGRDITLIQSLMTSAAGGLIGSLQGLGKFKKVSQKKPAYIWHQIRNKQN